MIAFFDDGVLGGETLIFDSHDGECKVFSSHYVSLPVTSLNVRLVQILNSDLFFPPLFPALAPVPTLGNLGAFSIIFIDLVHLTLFRGWVPLAALLQA